MTRFTGPAYLAFPLVAALSACAPDPVAPPASDGIRFTLPAQVVATPDSRARFTIRTTMPDGVTPTGFTGDGRLADGTSAGGGASVYEGERCDVRGKIFWYDTGLSQSGDAVFSPDASKAVGGCPGGVRTVNAGPFTAIAPPMNAMTIMQLALGEARVQQFGLGLGLRTCDRLQYRPDLGGGVEVVRTAGDANFVLGSWTVRSVGDHRAHCVVLRSKSYVPTGESFVIPLHLQIDELR